MINVLKAYCTEIDQDSIVVTGPLSKSRKEMGWTDNGKLFKQHHILSDEEWFEAGTKLIDRHSDRMHIFNGITYPARMTRLILYAAGKDVPFCNMSEAYFNLESGWRRIAKKIYIDYVLPLKTRQIARKSLGVMCLSGSSDRDMGQFRKLGFKKQDIYPFGYYTQADGQVAYTPAADGKTHLLCPGLLEPYKGVDILIKALHLLWSRGVRNFVCHITGKGSMEHKLRQMIDNLGLNECVKLEGVMDDETYTHLLTCIDILVAPGRVEPWGIRINEAIQRGQAVVVSDGLGASSLIQKSEGGIVFHSKNCEELAEAVGYLLGNPSRLAAARKNNLSFRHEISCGAQAKQLHSHIGEIIRKHPFLKK